MRILILVCSIVGLLSGLFTLYNLYQADQMLDQTLRDLQHINRVLEERRSK